MANPRSHGYRGSLEVTLSFARATEPGEPISRSGDDITAKVDFVVPAPGGSRLLILTVPRDAHMSLPSFDAAPYVSE